MPIIPGWIGYDHGNFDWKDCHIPEEQLKWLEDDLKRHPQPGLYDHQQLDGPAFPDDHTRYCPDNADQRAILNDRVKCLLFSRSLSRRGIYILIVYPYTLKVVIEGSGAHSLVPLWRSGTI